VTVASAKSPQSGDELVTVAVGSQQFAIDIMSVREIRGWTQSTPLPNAASHFLGMINLRGLILPVIDLSARLGLGPSKLAPSSVVVVVQGMIQPTPDVGAGAEANLVQGVMTTDQGIIGLLALDHVVPAEEPNILAASAKAARAPRSRSNSRPVAARGAKRGFPPCDQPSHHGAAAASSPCQRSWQEIYPRRNFISIVPLGLQDLIGNCA